MTNTCLRFGVYDIPINAIYKGGNDLYDDDFWNGVGYITGNPYIKSPYTEGQYLRGKSRSVE